MKENLIALVTGLIFFIVGIVCIGWPKWIQQKSLDYYIHDKTAEKLNPFMGWMKTSSYVFSLRLIGLVCIVVFGVMVIVLIRGK
jgi:hypothetical protein